MSEQADLVVLVPDSHWRAVIEAIIPRYQALGIRRITMKEPIVQPRRDPGVRTEGPAMLRLHAGTARHALLILDFEGSGARGSADGPQGDLQQRLDVDWNRRALALVVEPELEDWLRAHREAPSASIWRALANRASLDPTRCRQPSFRCFVETLRRWFPPPPP